MTVLGLVRGGWILTASIFKKRRNGRSHGLSLCRCDGRNELESSETCLPLSAVCHDIREGFYTVIFQSKSVLRLRTKARMFVIQTLRQCGASETRCAPIPESRSRTRLVYALFESLATIQLQTSPAIFQRSLDESSQMCRSSFCRISRDDETQRRLTVCRISSMTRAKLVSISLD